MTAPAEASGTTEQIIARYEVRLRRALIARFGQATGREVAADAIAWAWEHQDQLHRSDNPAGLLYRVAQSQARRYRRWTRHQSAAAIAPDEAVAAYDPSLVDLFHALAKLPVNERVAVVLVHAHGERYDEVARVLGVSVAAVTNHVHRGLTRLRRLLKEST